MVLRFIPLAVLSAALFAVPSGAMRSGGSSDDGLIAFQRDPKGGISVIPADGGKSRAPAS